MDGNGKLSARELCIQGLVETGAAKVQYIPLESLIMLVVSRQITTKACNIMFEGIEKKSDTRTCHGILDSNAYVYGYGSSYQYWADRWTHGERGTETSAYLGPGRLTLGWEKWSDVNHDLISRFWRIRMASLHRVSCRELCNSSYDTVKWSNCYTTSWVKVACRAIRDVYETLWYLRQAMDSALKQQVKVQMMCVYWTDHPKPKRRHLFKVIGTYCNIELQDSRHSFACHESSHEKLAGDVCSTPATGQTP